MSNPPFTLPDNLTITIPEAGRLLGLGRDAAYRAADRGEIPSLKFGRRRVVPVPQLLQMVGGDFRPPPPSTSAADGSN